MVLCENQCNFFHLNINTYHYVFLAITNRQSRRIIGIFMLATSDEKGYCGSVEGQESTKDGLNWIGW